MIRVENIEVWGFDHAIRGMRNPMNSWLRSDSRQDDDTYLIGNNDLKLMKRLIRGGTEHRKFLRQIFISMDIVAPLYWWKEFDTYKVGTVSNSCSTMHKIHAKEFELEDFSYEHLNSESINRMKFLLQLLNIYRNSYIVSKDKQDWWQMIQLLPSSYNQRRTITMNYENAVSIIRQRTGHKLDEWNNFIGVLKTLPYITEFTE